jgi:hypothetical protein|nr:MAG TPA: hypothetical protein [Caudoviricetes sp.]
MVINKDDYELLKTIQQSPDQCLEVGALLSENQFAQLARLLGHRYVELVHDFGVTAFYGITESGKQAIQIFEANAEKDEVEEAVTADKYPALFENKVTGVIVLAINPTCGTIVKEATVEFEIGQYPLYIGTFQTCFQPFFDKTVWQRVQSVAINL